MRKLSEISLRERIRLNLISAMEKAGVNQVQLADKLGISKGTVNNWARGNNSPDIDMVPRICEVLNISILDFYSPESLFTEEKKPSGALIPAPEEEINDLFDYLNKALVSTGLIGEDQDLTPQQADVLVGVCQIIRAIFNKA